RDGPAYRITGHPELVEGSMVRRAHHAWWGQRDSDGYRIELPGALLHITMAEHTLDSVRQAAEVALHHVVPSASFRCCDSNAFAGRPGAHDERKIQAALAQNDESGDGAEMRQYVIRDHKVKFMPVERGVHRHR